MKNRKTSLTRLLALVLILSTFFFCAEIPIYAAGSGTVTEGGATYTYSGGTITGITPAAGETNLVIPETLDAIQSVSP